VARLEVVPLCQIEWKGSTPQQKEATTPSL
jgi:hypothetical protein